jgi:hypothetical protein
MTLPSSSSSSSGGVPVPHKLCPGDAYSYWRWAAALTFALANVAPPSEGTSSYTVTACSTYSDVHHITSLLEDCVVHIRWHVHQPCQYCTTAICVLNCVFTM